MVYSIATRQCFAVGFLADDEEYSVILKSELRVCRVVRAEDAVATWVALVYFEGALADAPASARSNVSSDPAIATAAIMMTRHLDIASSIWFGTTQTKQTVKRRQNRNAKNRLSNKTDPAFPH